ncbi:MAG: hypothetical protein LBV12_02860 [Puniceicoccales bacterium]|nr:hypothetical protein [Puniceicoccales bacterium]
MFIIEIMSLRQSTESLPHNSTFGHHNHRKAIYAFIVFTVSLVSILAYFKPSSQGIFLGDLGGNFSKAYDINETGMIVGSAETKNREMHAFLWTKEHGMQDLGTLGGESSYAYAINEVGIVRGNSKTKNGERHAFSWTKEHGMQLILDEQEDDDTDEILKHKGLLQISDEFSSVSFFNEDSLSVGLKSIETLYFTCPAGVDSTKRLGTLGGKSSHAYAINKAGMIVGSAETKNGEHHAFLWTEERGMQDLGTLGGKSSSAYAINEAGQIVGFINTASPWWVRIWDWLSKYLKLPQKYCPNLGDYALTQAALWTIPPQDDGKE